MLENLKKLIFGDGMHIPKNPKLYRQEKPSKHWGSKKKFNRKKARAKDKVARASRKANR